MYRNLTQGIRRLKTFTITKSGTADKKYHTHTHKHKDTHTHTHTHTTKNKKQKKSNKCRILRSLCLNKNN